MRACYFLLVGFLLAGCAEKNEPVSPSTEESSKQASVPALWEEEEEDKAGGIDIPAGETPRLPSRGVPGNFTVTPGEFEIEEASGIAVLSSEPEQVRQQIEEARKQDQALHEKGLAIAHPQRREIARRIERLEGVLRENAP